MERLLLFDIDGTLTRTQNGYLPFNEAIFNTFGFYGDIRTVVPDGNTDPLIVQDIFIKANVNFQFRDAAWEPFTTNLRERYHYHLLNGTTTIAPLPGAAVLLRALAASEEFSASVVTGNFEVTAEIKLEAAGLAPYLCRGAYASDSHHRPDLPAIAKSTLGKGHRTVAGVEPMRYCRRHAEGFRGGEAKSNELHSCRHRPLSDRRIAVLAAGRMSCGSDRHGFGSKHAGTILKGERCSIEPLAKPASEFPRSALAAAITRF